MNSAMSILKKLYQYQIKKISRNFEKKNQTENHPY